MLFCHFFPEPSYNVHLSLVFLRLHYFLCLQLCNDRQAKHQKMESGVCATHRGSVCFRLPGEVALQGKIQAKASISCSYVFWRKHIMY